MSYTVAVMSPQLSALGRAIVEHFQAEYVPSLDSRMMHIKRLHAVVLDLSDQPRLDLAPLQSLMQDERMIHTPIIILTSAYGIHDKLRAFELGCDDFIDASASQDEACARITKSIFNKIANEQLSKRLQRATDTARTAMVDNSDLGANIQFLLQVHDCDNLDQLGQRFFATIERYGLYCSLQMRSGLGLKNMEAHGMAKELESQLLWQLQNNGRYVDFGRRTIVNYDQTSVLIKNMPMDDPEKYSAIKETTLCLMQGLNARMLALEDRSQLQIEKQTLVTLIEDVTGIVQRCKHKYQDVQRRILTEVDNATEMIHNRLPHLSLKAPDEEFIEEVVEHLLEEAKKVFGEECEMNSLLEQLNTSAQRNLQTLENASTEKVGVKRPDGSNVVELF